MNALGALLGRWHKRLVCLVWLAVVGELLVSGRYLDFLRPEFSYALWLMAAILFCFILVDIADARKERIRAGELLIMAALLLPIPYLVHALGATLDSRAFTRRYVGGASSPIDISGYRANNGDALPDISPAEDTETNILEIYSNPERYLGKRIRIVGMLEKKNDQLRDIMQREFPMVFRFAINCCAADAMPLAMVVDGDVAPGLADDSWVRATGTFNVRKVNGQELPFLETATMEATSKPKQPYLY